MTGIELRLPELSGGTEAEQLQQLKSYLTMLTQQLQFAFDSAAEQQTAARTAGTAEAVRQENFSAIKSLIIRSAELTERLGDQIEKRLAGKYVAQSQFGTFIQETEQKITAGDQELRQEFSNMQSIGSQVEEIRDALLEVNASIRTGLLYYEPTGEPVYGVEIGQQEREDGVLRFRKFARLTAQRLSFYDSSDVEVAYISDDCLHITTADSAFLTAQDAAIGRLQMGPYSWQLGADGHLSLR